MSHDEARKAAVEAATRAVWGDCWNECDDETQAAALADTAAFISAFERTMASHGWQMVHTATLCDRWRDYRARGPMARVRAVEREE